MTTTDLDANSSALVLVDLQNGVLAMPLAPYSGDQVVASSRTLADHYRRRGSPVVLVTVAFPRGDGPPADVAGPPLPEVMPPDWDGVVDGLAEDGDVRVVKPSWGAFAGTDLADLLRERGVTTIVVAGVATNFGVEQTVREAVAQGFAVVVAEDACASVSPQHHTFAIEQILPMISRVRTVADLVSR